MITFSTQEEFEKAIFEYVLKNISLRVSTERSEVYYSRDYVPKVELYLEGELIAEGKAY